MTRPSAKTGFRVNSISWTYSRTGLVPWMLPRWRWLIKNYRPKVSTFRCIYVHCTVVSSLIVNPLSPIGVSANAYELLIRVVVYRACDLSFSM